MRLINFARNLFQRLFVAKIVKLKLYIIENIQLEGMKEVGHSGIYIVDCLKGMPYMPHDIDVQKISGSFGHSFEDRVAESIVRYARIHSAWVGIKQSRFIACKHMEDDEKKAYRSSFHQMIETGLLVRPGIKNGFWAWTNIYRDYVVCPTPILLGQLLRHQSQKKL